MFGNFSEQMSAIKEQYTYELVLSDFMEHN